MFPVITVGPFTKWGIDYTTCNPPSARGHRYIIVAVDYFTKWVEAMPTFKNDGETAALFLFNQIIARFGVPREIVTDHGSHFQNQMMTELTSKLGLRQEHSSPYYPQANGQVEAVNKTLKTMLQRTINSAKSNWHLMLYSALWAYRTSVKNASNLMNSVVMRHWLTKLIKIRLSVNMIGPSVLGFSLRATLSWFTTKIRTPWGQESSNPCGSDPS
jgi:hypothetical protein